jgi:hypothetical protein
VLLYDNQTRSMLQTDQPRPDLGSQSGTVETNPDGSTDIYFGPTAPDGKETNWLQTIPGKGREEAPPEQMQTRQGPTAEPRVGPS